jgi:hypothetical protein
MIACVLPPVPYYKSFRTATRSPKHNFDFFLIKIFIKKLTYVYSYESNFQEKIFLYDFHIFKLNDLKGIHDLYFQCLTQTLSVPATPSLVVLARIHRRPPGSRPVHTRASSCHYVTSV